MAVALKKHIKKPAKEDTILAIHNYFIIDPYSLFKPGVLGTGCHTPGFLKLLLFMHRYVFVSTIGTNNLWHDNGVI